MPSASARARMARAKGCEERASSPAARVIRSCADALPSGCTAATSGSPMVIVPVLSMANAVVLPGASTYAPPLISTPARAEAVSAATMETGVEMTRAHGQAITSSTSAL